MILPLIVRNGKHEEVCTLIRDVFSVNSNDITQLGAKSLAALLKEETCPITKLRYETGVFCGVSLLIQALLLVHRIVCVSTALKTLELSTSLICYRTTID